MEENFNPQQSLELIESMINRAKDKFAEDGFSYLLWGWVVFGCSITEFILLHFFQYPYHYMIWMVCWLVLLYQIFFLRKRNKERKVKTYTAYIIGYIWITFSVLLFLLFFLLGKLTSGNYNAFINPVILALYGMPVFLSGIILRFKPLIIGGIGCWLLCIAATYITNFDYQYLLIALAMLIAWIIPGYLLKIKFKKSA